jgi:predicted DNA-binding mobile mystery protein A
MNNTYTPLQIRLLEQKLNRFYRGRDVSRPTYGWLRAVREALGLTLESVGRKAGNSRMEIHAFEKSEARGRITLASLEKVADAMGCELVYAIVPKSGTITELAEQPAREEARDRVTAVEHSMALEGQAAGRVEEKINDEALRILKKRK